MTCPSCSAPVEGPFCSRCGARMPAPAPAAGYQYQPPPQPQTYPPAGYAAVPPQSYAYPPLPYIPRVQSHLKTLGILWCVYAGYRFLTGIAASIFLLGLRNSTFFDRFPQHGNFPFGSLAPMMGGIAAVVRVLTIGVSALALVTGFALLNRKSWGRTLAIVAAVLSLIKIPLGTGLGIYTLWVLAPGQSRAEYETMADHS
jgi:hypothetical protein